MDKILKSCQKNSISTKFDTNLSVTWGNYLNGKQQVLGLKRIFKQWIKTTSAF